jgi:carbon monoxide dehydrogenase subunit G
MLPYLLVALAVVVLILIVAAMQPAEFQLSRSTHITAAPAAVFAQVNDLHRWAAWSPWAKLDPTMQTTHTGAAAGPGAIYEWTGNSKVGAGRMTVLDSRAPELVRIKLEFLKPFAATNTTEFTFAAEGNGTAVNWRMSGPNNFMAKAFGLFVSIEKMVGRDFEKGLAQLKSVVETSQS